MPFRRMSSQVDNLVSKPPKLWLFLRKEFIEKSNIHENISDQIADAFGHLATVPFAGVGAQLKTLKLLRCFLGMTFGTSSRLPRNANFHNATTKFQPAGRTGSRSLTSVKWFSKPMRATSLRTNGWDRPLSPLGCHEETWREGVV